MENGTKGQLFQSPHVYNRRHYSPVQRLSISFFEPEHHVDSIITITWCDVARHHRLLAKNALYVHNRNCNKKQQIITNTVAEESEGSELPMDDPELLPSTFNPHNS
jgi:hypothetical protein